MSVSSRISSLFNSIYDWYYPAQFVKNEFIKAVKEGNLELVSHYLSEGTIDIHEMSDIRDMNDTNLLGFNILCVAAQNGNSEMVSLLLDAGAQVKTIDWGDIVIGSYIYTELGHHSPIYNALYFGKDINTLRVLIDADVDHNLTFKPLDIAILRGDLPSVDALLSTEQELNNSNFFGETPLSYAIRVNFVEGIKSLVEHGARTDGLLSTAVYNHETSALETMLDLGVSMTDTNDALLHAVSIHQVEAMKILLDHGADPNAKYSMSNISSIELIEERIATAKQDGMSQAHLEELVNLSDMLKDHHLNQEISTMKKAGEVLEINHIIHDDQSSMVVLQSVGSSFDVNATSVTQELPELNPASIEILII